MPLSSLSVAVWAVIALLSTLSCAAPASHVSSFRRSSTSRFNFGKEKVRGVNLGGWFVLEPWITPSIFEAAPAKCVDEWTLSAYYGKTVMEKKMQAHWSTWIVEEDFAQIAAAGLNLVRIPIGYWSVSPIAGQPFVQGAYAYLNKALGWAEKHGIAVLIDLHGAPGSQNGFDNSGRRGPIKWMTGDTVAQTHQALNKIRDDHASNPVVAAIELVNEPMGPVLGFDKIEDFYTAGYNALDSTDATIAIHDAFLGPPKWDPWASSRKNVLIDTHYYQIFTTEDVKMSAAQHIKTACKFGAELISKTPTICGEFTGAMTDCAKWLNGRGFGARYDGTYPNSSIIGSCENKSTGTVAGLSANEKANIRNYAQAQMAAFDKADGWIWWTWHTEAAPEWDYKALHNAGVLPYAGDLSKSACS